MFEVTESAARTIWFARPDAPGPRNVRATCTTSVQTSEEIWCTNRRLGLVRSAMPEHRISRPWDWYRSYAAPRRFSSTLLFLTLSGCDILPQRGDTTGEQQQAQWLTRGRLVIDTDPDLTIIRLGAERLDSAHGGHHVLLARFEFDPTPVSLGDEYALSLALDLGDIRQLRRATPYALGPPPARIPAFATVTCLCRPLRPDSVRGTFTISQRGIGQVIARIDATLFFTAWNDPSHHVTYRLRQRIDGVQ